MARILSGLNIYYVYEHLSLKTNKPFYVGKGCRERAFKDGKTRSVYWNRIANKHGVLVNILFSNLTEKEAFDKEVEIIHEYKKKYKLVNLTRGGEGWSGFIMTKKHRKKISKALTGLKRVPETIEKMRLVNLGKKLSDEHKAKISASGKGTTRPPIPYEKRLLYSKIYTGKRHSEKAKQKMSNALNERYSKTARYLLNIETGIYYRSGVEAAKTINKDFGYFYQMLRGERKNITSFIYAG
jgi:hypothetical protein